MRSTFATVKAFHSCRITNSLQVISITLPFVIFAFHYFRIYSRWGVLGKEPHLRGGLSRQGCRSFHAFFLRLSSLSMHAPCKKLPNWKRLAMSQPCTQAIRPEQVRGCQDLYFSKQAAMKRWDGTATKYRGAYIWKSRYVGGLLFNTTSSKRSKQCGMTEVLLNHFYTHECHLKANMVLICRSCYRILTLCRIFFDQAQLLPSWQVCEIFRKR